MKIENYSNVRKNLKHFLDYACESKKPVIITRSTGDNCVLISCEEYESIMETLHLLKEPVNAERLYLSAAQIRKKLEST